MTKSPSKPNPSYPKPTEQVTSANYRSTLSTDVPNPRYRKEIPLFFLTSIRIRALQIRGGRNRTGLIRSKLASQSLRDQLLIPTKAAGAQLLIGLQGGTSVTHHHKLLVSAHPGSCSKPRPDAEFASSSAPQRSTRRFLDRSPWHCCPRSYPQQVGLAADQVRALWGDGRGEGDLTDGGGSHSPRFLGTENPSAILHFGLLICSCTSDSPYPLEHNQAASSCRTPSSSISSHLMHVAPQPLCHSLLTFENHGERGLHILFICRGLPSPPSTS